MMNSRFFDQAPQATVTPENRDTNMLVQVVGRRERYHGGEYVRCRRRKMEMKNLSLRSLDEIERPQGEAVSIHLCSSGKVQGAL